MGKIVIISGPCGAGKSSLCRLLAKNDGAQRTVHIHTDDFYQYICKGYIPPWQEGSGGQNETVAGAAAACAAAYAQGGYAVYVDGVVGPWFLEPWRRLARQGLDLRYVVLRPGRQAVKKRAAEREKREEIPLSQENVEAMWEAFRDAGPYEDHVLDTTAQTPEESAAAVLAELERGGYPLS